VEEKSSWHRRFLLVLDLGAFLETIGGVLEVLKLAARRSLEKRENRVWKYLSELRPNQLVTARGLFLRFWGEALADLPVFPDQLSLSHRIKYQIKRRLMPFRSEAEVEKFLLRMQRDGVAEFDPAGGGWRLRRPNDTSRWRN
jgi:hypothetical protein